MLPDPILVVARVAHALEEVGVPYLVGGSFRFEWFQRPASLIGIDNDTIPT
jgi:hypothetical protein